MTSEDVTSAYLVKGQAGNVGTPGAPVLSFALVVIAATGRANGHVEITQALPPPFGSIKVNNVTGQIHKLGLPPAQMVVALEGTYWQSFPPPAIGEIQQHFRAALTVDDSWNGFGSFDYGGHTVSNVPVKKLP